MLIVKDATVVPMDRRRSLPHHDVLVEDGAIVDVVPTGGELPDGSTTIDGSGRHLIPGLFDAHGHFVRGDDVASAALKDLYVINGSTSMLCLDGFDHVYELRRSIGAGETFGPTIFTSGPIQNDAELTYEGGRAEALREAEAGCLFVKVYNDLAVEGYRGLVDGAREAGIRVLGHVPRAPGLEGVYAAGQVCVVHAEEFLYTHFGYSVGGDFDWRDGGPLDPAELPRLAAHLADVGMVVGPTIRNFFTIWQQCEDLEPWARSEQLEYLPASLVDRWLPPRNRFVDLFAAAPRRRNLQEGFWFQMRMIEALHAAGVPLTAGTDTTVPHLVPASLHHEIALLATAGLGDYEALKAATVNPAQLVEPGTKRGTIQKGAPADLVLLGADPLADVRAVADIDGVMLRGAWHDRADLDARLAALRSAHARPQVVAA